MRRLDHVALSEALERGDDAARESAARALGVELRRSEVSALVELCARTSCKSVTLPFVVALVQRALEAEHGLAYERVDDRARVVHCLVVRWKDDTGKGWVTIGVSRTFGSKKIGAVWSRLEPWAKRLENNRERLEAWARTPSHDQLRFALSDAAATSETETETETAEARAREAAEEAALLRAVIESPDDDAPRLVYADWLLERGDARGELITLQCELFRETSRARKLELKRRADGMLAASLRSFAGELTPYTRKEWFERGFPARVGMTVAAFAKEGKRLLDAAPVTALTVSDARPTEKSLAKLAATPHLGRIRTLELAPSTPYSLPLAPLADSPHLGRLRRIELTVCGHSARDWESFFGRLDAPMLEEVALRANRSSAGLFRGLARNPALGRLRAIAEYRSVDLDESSEGDLAAALEELSVARPSLEELSLWNHENVRDRAIASFFAGERGARLRALHLIKCPVGDETARTLASSPRSTSLRSLEVHGGRVTPACLDPLLSSPNTAALERLAVQSLDAEVWTEDAVNAYAERLLAVPSSRALRNVTVPRLHLVAPKTRESLRERFFLEGDGASP